MSRTATRIAEPARHKDWGLTVDKMALPAEFIVVRYPGDGRRHGEPYDEVARVPYTVGVDAAIAQLIERTGMPDKTASALVFRVSMKLASPKAADADSGYRPVV
jgi:hypothetical protein